VNKQECFCILGPKGSGKTSLLDLITKAIYPTDGKIYFNGKILNKHSLNDLSVGYFQNTKIYLLNDTIKRIVKFIITICSQPDIIILDEPTVGMDVESKEKIWEAMDQIRKNRPNTILIIATSSLEEALTLGDRIGILINGHLECIGTPQELE
ncbi:hypothetical protein PIROE2DRAFT_35501, partial [Piromyces sp. E2]